MKDYQLTVKSNIMLCDDVFELTLESEEKLEKIRCGQFLHLEAPGYLLRRPFCVHKYDDNSVTVIIAAVGVGTKRLMQAKPGDKLRAILPIGNGFTLTDEHKTVVLIGGGVGGAPLLGVPADYPDKKYYTFLGFPSRDRVMFADDFAQVSELTLCTDDGSTGYHGYPTEALSKVICDIKPDVILTCGNTAFMKAVAKVALKHNVKAYMSCESRMGCGVGACLVCACAVKKEDGVHNMRACVDGPVFDLEEIQL